METTELQRVVGTRLEWNARQLEIVKKTITPPGTTADELAFFVDWCKRTGLNPLIGQAFFIERKQKDATGVFVHKKMPLAAEAGMAAIADSQPDYAGIKCGTVYAGDDFSVDEDTATVSHKWNLEQRQSAGNVLLGAWARVLRKGVHTPVCFVSLSARTPEYQNRFWKNDAAGMLTKCARADAWRRAYPNLFSGVYVQEEMEPEAEASPTAQAVATLERVSGFKEEGTKPDPAAFIIPGGAHRGKRISELSDAELSGVVDALRAAIDSPEKEKNKAYNERVLEHVLAYVMNRESAKGGEK